MLGAERDERALLPYNCETLMQKNQKSSFFWVTFSLPYSLKAKVQQLRSCARHEQGYKTMKNLKKRIACIFTAATLLCIGGLCLASASGNNSPSDSDDKYRTFVKTNAKCRNSNCQCSGYWGYRHGNGTYEGNCCNTDGFGHTCGHGPEAHGLRRW